MNKLSRIVSVVQFRPHDTSTEHGRSHERYRRMALTSAAAFGYRGIGLLASFISVPLTFRYLGPERYGLWMVLTSIIAAMAFADLGIGNGVINYVAEAYGKDDRDLAREYVTSALFLLLGIAALFAIAGAIAYPLIPWMRVFNVKSASVASEGATAFLILYGWFVINIPLGIVSRVQSGLQEAYWPQVIGACGNVLSLLALILVVAIHGSLSLLVFASTFGSIAATLLNAWLLFREHKWLVPHPRDFSQPSAEKILQLGLMFFILQCAVTIGFTSDNIVITQVLGAAAVATYAVPQKLFGVITMLLGMTLATLWPAYGEAIARGALRWVRQVFIGSLRATLATTIPVTTLMVISGPWVLRVIFGKNLHAPLSLLIVLAVWVVVNGVSGVIAVLLNGAGVLKAQAIAAVFASLSNLALSILLTRRYGVVGVCLGSIITQLLITFPTCFFLIRRLFKRLEMTSVANGPKEAIFPA